MHGCFMDVDQSKCLLMNRWFRSIANGIKNWLVFNSRSKRTNYGIHEYREVIEICIEV